MSAPSTLSIHTASLALNWIDDEKHTVTVIDIAPDTSWRERRRREPRTIDTDRIRSWWGRQPYNIAYAARGDYLPLPLPLPAWIARLLEHEPALPALPLPDGTPMDAPNNNTAAKGLGGWWASPPRSGMRLFISPWEYRHLRAFSDVRIAGGIALAGLGIVTLAFGGNDWRTYGWRRRSSRRRRQTWPSPAGSGASLAPSLPRPERACTQAASWISINADVSHR